MPFSTLNDESFKALFNYASIGILIVDASGDIQMTNKFIEKQFDYGPHELLGRKVEVLIPQRFHKKHVKHRGDFTESPHNRPMGQGMELWGVRKDGTEFPVEVSLGHYQIEGKKFSLAFINDISHRRETEQAIVQLNAHLEEKVKARSQSLAITVEQLGNQMKETERKDKELERVNTFLNNIWNHAGAIIFVCDADGLIGFFNPAAEKALGYSASDVINKKNIVDFHLQEELESRSIEVSNVLGEEITQGFELLVKLAQMGKGNNQEWNYARRDGSTFFVSLNFTPLKNPFSGLSGYLGIAIDISDKKKAEAELRASLEKEKELNELKSRFVSMASHEFRTPLSAVLSSAFLLSKYVNTEGQPQREKHIRRIVSSVTSLTEILNHFLSVGKIEEGRLEAKLAEYDIRQQMQEIVQDMSHMLKKGQAITYTHTGERAEVVLDPLMIKHIVTNLLSNAIKFSNEDGGIELNTTVGGDVITLSVKDAGIGIPEEDMHNLFNRFFRSSNATNIQGTGLGLHIVARYAELLNGKVACESKLGVGTKFTITFNNN